MAAEPFIYVIDDDPAIRRSLERLLDAGAIVGLGVDGNASNESGRMVDELHQAGFAKHEIGFAIRGDDAVAGGMITDAEGTHDAEGAAKGATAGAVMRAPAYRRVRRRLIASSSSTSSRSFVRPAASFIAIRSSIDATKTLKPPTS